VNGSARRRSARSNEPSGYYFAVGPGREDDGWDCTVYMTDAVYFDTTGNQSDWHITPELTRGGGMRMPPGLSEEAEGVFTYEGQPENAIEDLSRRGFRRSDAFNQMMADEDPQQAPAFVVYGPDPRARSPRGATPYTFGQEPPLGTYGRGGRSRLGHILVPAIDQAVLARAPESRLTQEDVSEILGILGMGTTPTRRPRNPERAPRGRKDAVAKKPPGKTIWERLDEED